MNESVRQALANLLTHHDPDVRRHAAEELAGHSGLAVVAGLAAALKDSHQGVRDAASHAIVRIGGEHAARAIVEYIGDENPVTRNLAAELLVRLGAPSVSALLPYLHDANRDTRKIAVDTLGLIRTNVPVASLIPLLHDADENVVVSTVEALGLLGAEDAVGPLCRAFEHYPYARASIVEALGRIGGEQARRFLGELLRSLPQHPPPDPILLFALFEAVCSVGTAEELPHLQRFSTIVRGPLQRMLWHCLVCIAERSGHPLPSNEVSRRALLDSLTDRSLAVRLSAVRGLAQMQGDDVTRVLLSALGRDEQTDVLLQDVLTERPRVFQFTVEALQTVVPERRLALVLFLRRQVMDLIRNIARVGWMNIDASLLDRAFTAVAEAWRPAEEEARGPIMDTLFRLDGDRAVSFFDTLADDPDPWIRMQLVDLLSCVEDPRVPEFLEQFLDDEYEMVQQTAGEALQRRREASGGEMAVVT